MMERMEAPYTAAINCGVDAEREEHSVNAFVRGLRGGKVSEAGLRALAEHARLLEATRKKMQLMREAIQMNAALAEKRGSV